jgi:hypothetical protein
MIIVHPLFTIQSTPIGGSVGVKIGGGRGTPKVNNYICILLIIITLPTFIIHTTTIVVYTYITSIVSL